MTAAKADGREPQQRTRTTVYGVTEPSEYVCGEMLKSSQINAHHFFDYLWRVVVRRRFGPLTDERQPQRLLVRWLRRILPAIWRLIGCGCCVLLFAAGILTSSRLCTLAQLARRVPT